MPSKNNLKAASISNRIATRVGVDGYGEFYDTVTGNTFIPRGNNYIQLDGVNGYHNMFDPGSYNTSAINSALNQMHNNGYNITRVFLNNKKLGGLLTQPGVDPTYMSNLIDYLNRARAHDTYVTISLDFMAPNYHTIVDALPPTPYCEAGGTNTMFMSSRHIVAYKAMMTDIVEYINTADSSLLSTVFSWDTRNEAHFKSDMEPFSMTSGMVTPADGGTYDMANAKRRQLAADNSAIYFVNQISEGIKSIDPNALVGSSVFTPKAVSRDGYDGVAPTTPEHPDNRAPFMVTALDNSNLDLIDIHQYSLGPGHDIAVDLNSTEIGLISKNKPRIMSEFGAHKGFYPNFNTVVPMLKNHLATVCNYGFRGGIYWNWDETDLTDYWTALESGGAINNNISPNAYPNPCAFAPNPLIFTKSVNKTSANIGETLIYTLNYENQSTKTYTNVRFEDFIPIGTNYLNNSASDNGVYDNVNHKITWTLGDLLPLAKKSMTFQVSIF